MKKLVLFVAALFFASSIMAGEPGQEIRPNTVKIAPVKAAPAPVTAVETPEYVEVTPPAPPTAVAPIQEITVPQDVTAYETPVTKSIEVNPVIEVSSEPKFEIKSNPKTVVITPDVKINEISAYQAPAPQAKFKAKELLPLDVETQPSVAPDPVYSYCCCLPVCCSIYPGDLVAPSVGVSEIPVQNDEGYFERVGKQLKEGITQSAFCWTPLFTSQSDTIEVSSANSGFWNSTNSFVVKAIDGTGKTVSKAGNGVWKTATAVIPR